MAEHVLAVAPQRFSIAGHSPGGWVAQEVAARRRSGCRSCSSATPARKPEGTDEYLRNYWANAERDLDGARTEHFRLLLQRTATATTRAVRACSAGSGRWAPTIHPSTQGTRRALQHRRPTAANHGRHVGDPRPSRPRRGRGGSGVSRRDGIDGAALALIEEAGHCSPIEQPQAFTAVMRLWLTR